jgi:hypothetical protein
MTKANGHKSKFRIRIKGFKTKAADRFNFNPLNWRRHGDAQREALRVMLGDVGWVQGVIENVRTGNLIDGHARIEEALRDDPKQRVPYLVVDLSPAEEKAVLATLDPIGAMAEVDPAILDRLYQETIVDMPGLEQLLTSLHYNQGDDNEGGDDDQDTTIGIERAAELQKKWKVKQGDLWTIGRHRLLCGDCRDPGAVDKLIKRGPINVAVTSPPYAEQRDYDAESGFEPIPPDKYVAWFRLVSDNVAAHLASDGSWFVNIKPPGRELDTDLYVHDLVAAHVREWGWHFATEFCWERNGVPKQVVQRFKNQFEPIYQFVRSRWKIRPENVRHASDNMIIPFGKGAGDTSWDRFQGGGEFFKPSQFQKRLHGTRMGMSTVQGTNAAPGGYIGEGWAYPGNRLPTMVETHEATGHAAAFPVGLPAFFIKAFSDEGDLIYEPFAGSGSTLVAAEQTKRRGVAMELSPKYCALTLERMATAFPKLKIVKVGP